MEIFRTALLLTFSNLFMLYAWYGHVKKLGTKPLLTVIMISWGIAFFEYLLQVPANRIGSRIMDFGQLKILQESITLIVFIPFSIYFLKEKPNSDYLIAALLILTAVFFIFRGKFSGLWYTCIWFDKSSKWAQYIWWCFNFLNTWCIISVMIIIGIVPYNLH